QTKRALRAWPSRLKLQFHPELDDSRTVLLRRHLTEDGAGAGSGSEVRRSKILNKGYRIASIREDHSVQGVEEVGLELYICPFRNLRALGYRQILIEIRRHA